ncbi:hypothetical protein ABEF95_009446 [Exophiala dermatitidis]
MAASPSYGDRPPLQGYRRSFTVPARPLSLHERAGLDEADADCKILYSHPSARIIAFSPPTDSIPRSSRETLPETDYPVDTIETLPWRSRTETLAATGPLVIEKVRGSSHFLKSADQKVIHPIMRNSQCWCVDGESKFVLRIGKFRYCRLEFPSETDADKAKVEELKSVLSKILRFERTPCPFKRAFHVDLPDDAITPRPKKMWQPKQQPVSTTPKTDPLPLQRSKTARAWSLQGQVSPTPLYAYGRRGSDYGFTTSRSSSPRPQHDAGEYCPATPSSLASSEGPRGATQEETPNEAGGSKQEIDSSTVTPISTVDSPVSPEVAALQHQPQENDTESSVLQGTIDQLPTKENQAAPIERLQSQAETVAENVHQDPPENSLAQPAGDAGAEKESRSESVCSQEPDAAALKPTDSEPPPTGGLGLSSQVVSEDPVCQNPSTPDLPHDGGCQSAQGPFFLTPDHKQDQDALCSKDETSESPLLSFSDPTQVDDVLSRVSSADSFHTTSSPTEESAPRGFEPVDIEAIPHTEQVDDAFSGGIRQHQREVSESTVTAASEQIIADLRPSTSESLESKSPSTPALGRSSASESSWPEVQTPSPVNEGLRERLKARRERSLSPLPPSTTVFLPPPPSSPSSQGGHFTAAILQKACNVALVKPIEAVVLLVHILARIAGGATVSDLLSGELFRRPEQLERRRRSSFPDQISALPHPSDEDEDDFGVPLHRGRTQGAEMKPATVFAPMKGKGTDDETDSLYDLD